MLAKFITNNFFMSVKKVKTLILGTKKVLSNVFGEKKLGTSRTCAGK